MSIIGIMLRGFGGTASASPPATPTLTAVDQENGTSIATIASSTTGSTNVVYTARLASMGSVTFTSSGTRTGDGNVTLTLSSGLYWAYVASSSGGLTSNSNFILLRVSTGTDAMFYQCLDEVRDTILTLSLTGIADADVRIQKLPWRAAQVEPGIFITPTSESLNSNDGTNERDDIGYPIQVVMIQKSNRDQTLNFQRFLLWRQRIRHAFHNQPLNLLTVHTAVVEPGAVILPTAFEGQFDVQSLIIRCTSRETRGLS